MRPWRSALCTAALIAASIPAIAGAAPPAPCEMLLAVELTPDVPDPRDPGFLSSLLSNHPGYRLTLRNQLDASVVLLELTGPGPDDGCLAVVDTMRNDARVQSIEVSSAPSQP